MLYVGYEVTLLLSDKDWVRRDNRSIDYFSKDSISRLLTHHVISIVYNKSATVVSSPLLQSRM